MPDRPDPTSEDSAGPPDSASPPDSAGPSSAGPPAAARAVVLARIRAALVASPPVAPVPERDYRRAGVTDRDALVALLTDRLTDYRARVHHDLGASGTPEPAKGSPVLTVLAGTGTVVVPADLPRQWYAGFGGRVLVDRPADPVPVSDLDAAGVSVLTGCAVAIAETGTIVLDTGARQGRRVLTLVPDHHICVVGVDQIVATVPEGLARLPDPTRPLTFISGPSATSDIELNRIEGVHGPRRLDVVIAPFTAP